MAITVKSGGGKNPTGNIELTQQSGTDVTDYATASVRSGSVTLNTPTINSSTGVVTASASVGTTGWIGSAPSSKTLSLSTQAAKTITPSTSSQTAVAAGKYTTGAVKVAAMPSGTLGTVSASKSISGTTATVTPKIAAGTAGYNAMAAKSGTAVTVTASEVCTLGTKSITSNGTVDITGYSSASVNVTDAPVLLWTNPNPSSGFSVQTVSVATGYNAYMVELEYSTSATDWCGVGYLKFGTFSGITACVYNNVSSQISYFSSRLCRNVTDGSITFESTGSNLSV